MSRGAAAAAVELDFFAKGKEISSANNSYRFRNTVNRQRSFRDIQGAISRINPEVLKSVIAFGSANTENGSNFIDSKRSFSVPSTPKDETRAFPSLPVYKHISRPASETVLETLPLTIFYNGTVTVFDLPREKAESILKFASEPNSKSVESKVTNVANHQQQLLETLNNGDLPIARRKSLQRFLEKRKERLTSVSPYICHD